MKLICSVFLLLLCTYESNIACGQIVKSPFKDPKAVESLRKNSNRTSQVAIRTSISIGGVTRGKGERQGATYSRTGIGFMTITPQGNAHEWGIFNPTWGGSGEILDTTRTPLRNRRLGVGISYQYRLNFSIKSEKNQSPWALFLGFGGYMEYLLRSGEFNPDFFGGFPTKDQRATVMSKEQSFIAGLELIPGSRWNIGSRLWGEIAIPLTVVEFSTFSIEENILNSSNEVELQSTHPSYMNYLNTLLAFQFGLGFYL